MDKTEKIRLTYFQQKIQLSSGNKFFKYFLTLYNPYRPVSMQTIIREYNSCCSFCSLHGSERDAEHPVFKLYHLMWMHPPPRDKLEHAYWIRSTFH